MLNLTQDKSVSVFNSPMQSHYGSFKNAGGLVFAGQPIYWF